VKNNALWLATLFLMIAGCSSPDEPVVTPPNPSFVPNSNVTDPVEHGIYADVDATLDAIWIEWNADSTETTTGYVLYRSLDDTIDTDGLLTHRITIARFESTNPLIDRLPSSYRDTVGIVSGVRYWYQLLAFHRSPTGKVTYSTPTRVSDTTSFRYLDRPEIESPNGIESLQSGLPLKLRWRDPSLGAQGGHFLIIIQRLDNLKFVCVQDVRSFGLDISAEYPTPPEADSLEKDVPYRWRVKCLATYGGSTSAWIPFGITP
jgi:hypothetical protein